MKTGEGSSSRASASEASTGEGRAPEVPSSEERVHERRIHTHPRGSLRLVLVRWHDAWFDLEQPTGGWRDDYLVQTVGFLMREGPDVISVAQELLPWRDGFRAVTHIPLGIVESVTTLFHDEEPARRAGDRELQRDA
jgi:hypothetical protein